MSNKLLTKEDFIEFWQTVRTDAISAMFDNVGENGIYPTGIFFKAIDSSFETALTEYAKQMMYGIADYINDNDIKWIKPDSWGSGKDNTERMVEEYLNYLQCTKP